MSTFQEIIHVFNDTHVTNAIHEKVCVIFYGTDLNPKYVSNANNLIIIGGILGINGYTLICHATTYFMPKHDKKL